VMSSVVVAEASWLMRICVLVDVEQTLYGGFDVHELTDVQDRGIHKLPTNIPLVGPPLIVGHAGELHYRTGINKVSELLKIGFNLHIG